MLAVRRYDPKSCVETIESKHPRQLTPEQKRLSAAMTPEEVKPLAVSMREFCRLTSLGRTLAFSLAREQRIETRRINGRTLVLMRSIEALLELNEKRG